MAIKIQNKPFTKTKKAQQPKIQVDTNIRITQHQHHELVEHIKEKLEFGNGMRNRQAAKFEKIDRQHYGYLVLDHDDEKRKLDNERGYGVKPTDTSLPMSMTQIDEAVTYLIEVLGNDSNLYGALAPKEKQPVAAGFAALMNEHANKFHHIDEINKWLTEALKYNFAGLIPEWKTVYGTKLSNATGTQALKIESGEIYAGNELTCIDPYNFIYDVSVDPLKLNREGEFFATIEVHTPFKVQKMEADKEIYNTDKFLKKAGSNYSISWYRQRPRVRPDSHSGDSNNWAGILSAGNETESNKVVEFVTMPIWIQPSKYGLSTETKLELWRLTLANNTTIVRATRLNNAHGLLPIAITMPWNDGFKEDTKSFSELLEPFQRFASFQMNVHQKANRKSLYGLIFYNKNVIDLDDNYDPVAGKIPVNAPPDVDLNRAIRFINDSPDTQNTLRDIGNTNDMMQAILPTQILQQVAGLDRATQYQSAATVQGANRRNLKIAKLIESQGFSDAKNMQMTNILQYQKSVDILTQTGEEIEINPAEFRETKLEFTVSEGLRGLDKLSLTMNYKELLNSILQSQQGSQQVDVVALMNYISSMWGDKTDLSQFKYMSEMDKLPPEMRDLAFQLLQAYEAQQKAGNQTQQQAAIQQ